MGTFLRPQFEVRNSFGEFAELLNRHLIREESGLPPSVSFKSQLTRGPDYANVVSANNAGGVPYRRKMQRTQLTQHTRVLILLTKFLMQELLPCARDGYRKEPKARFEACQRRNICERRFNLEAVFLLSDRERGGQVPVPEREPLRLRIADLSRHVGCGRARGPLPLPVTRGLLRPHTGIEGKFCQRSFC